MNKILSLVSARFRQIFINLSEEKRTHNSFKRWLSDGNIGRILFDSVLIRSPAVLRSP